MKITELSHDCDMFFLNGDFVSFQNYVIVNDRKEVFRNGRLLELSEVCSLGCPKVKIISSERFLLIDSDKPVDSQDRRTNAWILNNKGEVERSFFLGNVHKVITTEDYIICSYTDSALSTDWPYGQNGMLVFDYNGRSLFEYFRDVEEGKGVDFYENYAFLKKNKEAIYFMPYMDFPIVAFSLLDFSSKVVVQLPKEEELNNDLFWNPKAFSKKGDNWYFITPDVDNLESRIFKMNPQKEMKEIGRCHFSHFPVGLAGGRFFIPFSGGVGSQKKCQFIEI